MRVYVQVIDTFSGIYQTGMIEEKVQEGHEIENALLHFGAKYGEINWEVKQPNFGFGKIRDTFKVVTYYSYDRL